MLNFWKKRTDFPLEAAKIADFMGRNDFEMALTREKLRSDRTLKTFTLVLFGIDKKAVSEPEYVALMIALAKVAVECSRISDIKGWHWNGDEEKIGLILNDTLPQHSSVIVDKVIACVENRIHKRAEFRNVRELVQTEIWSYPHQDVQERRLAETPEPAGSESNAILMAYRIPLWKRTLDVAVTLLVLLLLSPVMLLVALLIKTVSDGPVFYKQLRIGRNGKAFFMWKFRTMHNNADTTLHQQYVKSLIRDSVNGSAEKPMLKINNDPRIIPLGRWIRKSSVDELPQLFNVLWGEMSLVGPRPCLPYEVQEFALWQKNRLGVLPGMTGLWQTNGKNNTTFKDMIRYDITYSRKHSLWFDVRIILRTPITILADVCAVKKVKVLNRNEVKNNA